MRHWYLGWAMTLGASTAAVAPAATSTPPAFTRNLRRSMKSSRLSSEGATSRARPKGATAPSEVLGKEGGGRLGEHRGAPHLLVEERDDGAHAPVELLPDGLEVIVLHAHPVQHELRRVRPQR